MAQRRRSWRRRNGEAWRGIVSRFAASGLTLREYCARERISTTSFYRARRVCSGSARNEVVAGDAATPVAASFLDLGTLASPGSRLELRLDLGGGVILQIARG